MDYQNRNEIETIYQWDLTHLYPNLIAWEQDYKRVKKSLAKIMTYQGQLLTGSLLPALDTYFKTSANITKLWVYAHAKFDENLSHNDHSLLVDRSLALFSQLARKAAYLEPEILKGRKAQLKKLMNEPKLKPYRFYLANLLRRGNHLLKADEEIIVAKLTESSENFAKINAILTNATLTYGSIMIDGVKTPITNSNYRTIMTNPNRMVRQECHQLLTKKLGEFASIFATSLVAYMKTTNNLAEVHKFSSLLEMNLFASNIPPAVYTNLFGIIETRTDVLQKYFKMIRQTLALEQLEYHDLKTNLVNAKLGFTVEEARLLLEKALAILGDDYVKLIRKAFNERWIDFGTYQGKCAGAYMTATYGYHPFILTNFRGHFTDVSTLAHELGHAINEYLSMAANERHNYESSLFNAEVASLTNEVLLSHYIITHSNEQNLKLTALANLLDTIQDNLFDACIEGKLEDEIYQLMDKGEEISVDTLSELTYQIRSNYYGNTVKLDDSIKIMWARRAHYFEPYYLFKYATGMSAALYIAKKIIKDEDNMKIKYLSFLTKGGTNYPTEILKEIGVDMTKPTVINEALDFMSDLIDEWGRISEEL